MTTAMRNAQPSRGRRNESGRTSVDDSDLEVTDRDRGM